MSPLVWWGVMLLLSLVCMVSLAVVLVLGVRRPAVTQWAGLIGIAASVVGTVVGVARFM